MTATKNICLHSKINQTPHGMTFSTETSTVGLSSLTQEVMNSTAGFNTLMENGLRLDL